VAAVEINAATAGSWRLGDLRVNRLGFGAMRLTGRAAFGLSESRDRGQALSVLRRAVELGVNHIDTAAPGHPSPSRGQPQPLPGQPQPPPGQSDRPPGQPNRTPGQLS
jgi:hypothetical protein